MTSLTKGRYRARFAKEARDVDRALALRGRAFGKAEDRDQFDDAFRHGLIEVAGTGDLVGCFRFKPYDSGALISQGYAAQFYDISRLAGQPGAKAELGRFCMAPDRHDPDILRLAWGLITRAVDEAGVTTLFGCASFQGIDPARHSAAFAQLHANHLARPEVLPGPRASELVWFGRQRADTALGAGAQLPPLLRSYLAMGGWVSDHAVIDRAMDTIHVFTGLDLASVPPARARFLRAIAG